MQHNFGNLLFGDEEEAQQGKAGKMFPNVCFAYKSSLLGQSAVV